MLFDVPETVDHPVHDAPGVAAWPERTWMVTVVPAGVVTLRSSVSQPTGAPASMTDDV